MAWRQIGTNPAADVVAGAAGVFATNPDTGSIYRYTGEGTTWRKVGEEGAEFAVAGSSLFGRSPALGADVPLGRGTDVWQWSGNGTQWQRVGQGFSSIVGGGTRLLAINATTRDVYRFDARAGTWEKIGGPGAMLAAGGGIFGLTPRRDAIYRWIRGADWQHIGGGADAIYADAGGGCFAVEPGSRKLLRWDGGTDWYVVGTPGHAFAAGATIFGISPGRDAVMQWVGGTEWRRVGDKAAKIAVWHHHSADHVYVIHPDDGTIWYAWFPTP